MVDGVGNSLNIPRDHVMPYRGVRCNKQSSEKGLYTKKGPMRIHLA